MEPRFMATAIGSLPHTDTGAACRLMLENLTGMPPWPQLPARCFLENMYAQYSEGLPGIRVDESARRVWFQSDEMTADELEEFYRLVIEEDLDSFAVSERYAAGLAGFLGGEFEEELEGRPFIKGQVTGPVTFGLTVSDQAGRASLYDGTLEQAIVKGLNLKARWQSRELKRAAPEADVVLFFDEPYLVSVGSALVGVTREQVIRDIKECIAGCGADVTGIHCCGNTDWSILFEVGVDIVNFDAFGCLEGFTAYHREIEAHISRGGVIAWGVVPDSEKAIGLSAGGLADILEGAFDTLEGRGIDRETLARQSIVTPACGLGPTSVEAAGAALSLTGELSNLLRMRYF
ncbi:MAG: methionine synthase [Actinomycetia bacterium]|nr:methionine synthase [Actinomycetes bacterium]